MSTDPERERQLRYFKLAVESMGECLTDFGRLLLQGWREDNGHLRGNIALGLERTASYLRGQPFEARIDGKHLS